MYHEYNSPNQVGQVHLFLTKLLTRETRREIILPVSVSEAKYRIQIAFADTIKISNGFFSPKYKYTGQVIDTVMDIKFSIDGRSKMNYSMQGEIFAHPKGSRVSMVIKDENRWSLIWSIVCFAIFITLVPGGRDHIFFFIFAVLINIPALAWHRSKAADNIAALIYKIVNNNPG